ncbi:spermatogenesis associated 2-like [Antennarius striatus]|uniref:spermatogenesis associated 2-like n=1 Tax=Antennarius striatus TaxID=241820 RepID=UPI0035B053E4
MKDMSISRERAPDLVTAYNHSLEQQIVRRGSSLLCRDEELMKQVEALLREGDAQEIHCLGCDPLVVMEDSLKTAAAATKKSRGGLQGLAKAFEVLEQAALNLYLSPWREEYRVVKMYSGTFTHYVKPVLSMPQIEKLFGLLGYKPNSSRHEQLRLQLRRVSRASVDNLLSLSCAFFLARCECRLLLTALGKHAGEAQWELSLVRERLRGDSLQVALENTKKLLEVNQPVFDGELEVDLYTDEQINGGQRGAVVKEESPRSLTWMTHSIASPPAVRSHSNESTSSNPPFTSLPTKEDVRISTLTYQLTKSSLLDSDIIRSSSSNTEDDRGPCDESTFDKAESTSCSLQAEAETNHLCSCLQSPHLHLRRCIDCNTLHNSTCALLQHCSRAFHLVVATDHTSPEAQRASPTLTGSSAAMASLVLQDDLESMISSHPIMFHDCCDLNHLDPQVLCFTCGVFHSGSCIEIELCQGLHKIKPLGVCTCGRPCSRKPLVLCRYCGNEYCSDCWYRSPLVCVCGQTFDQSSSV